MVKQTIQIFGRVKPTKAKTGPYELLDSDGVPMISFNIPKDLAHDYINNKKEIYKFRFQKVFDQTSKQDEVFEHVAKPVIDNVLQGYNGTIFAYGQTGSGKTFTITGGAERYTDRGIIPRCLSYIFDFYEKNSEWEYSTHISYLEIYNENGYDLLDPKHEAAKLEDLPKVHLMEDVDQNIHLKNLSTHQAASEEEALNLLFLGDTNRMIAETPMNQASTRSHCIFTIHVTAREPGSATVRRAKLHLVDLAGSERVGKTGVNGMLLTEAKYINLSLHYLEQVIVALSEKSRSHIPYRNSMMTSVLRDSLGGNCMTTMIATMSIEKKNIDESISTCRFAQRVALIKNDAIQNEELDPKLMIIRLKKEIQELKDELAMATGQQRTDLLSEEDLEKCQEAVQRFLDDPGIDSVLNIGADMRKINQCFKLLKQRVLDTGQLKQTLSTPPPQKEETPRDQPVEANPADIRKLKGIILQRDNEINILVNMLKKEKKRAADAIAAAESGVRSTLRSDTMSSNNSISMVTSQQSLNNGHHYDSSRSSSASTAPRSDESKPPSAGKWNHEQQRLQKEKEEKTKAKILGEMSMGRQEAFEIFRRDYHENQAIDDNKATLKQRYSEAKALGEKVNQSRTRINKLKTSIEQHRMSRVMQDQYDDGLVDLDNPEPDEMETDMREQMEDEKRRYRETFNQLRGLKSEIEHLQHLLEKSKVKLMKDFELWWAEQANLAQEQQQHLKSQAPASTKTAWRTPPITPIKSVASSSQSSVLSGVREDLSSSGSYRNGGRSNHGDHDGSSYSSQDTASQQRLLQSRRNSDRGSIPLTGDAQADADIMAFLRARQKIVKYSQQKPR